MKTNAYPAKEKLKQKTQISLLFEKGKWQTVGKIRIITLKTDDFENHKVGVSVSKRNFKKAVDRNRIKRLLRESYRLNKDIFKKSFGEKGLSMIFWISKELPESFQEVEKQFLNLCESKK